MFLDRELQDLESYIPRTNDINTQVSRVSVGWHLDHSLIVINAIIRVLKESEPRAYRWRPNLGRWFIFLMGSIPRGRGVSPKSVLPDEITESGLYYKLQACKDSVTFLEELDPRCHFTHPYFGTMNLNNTKRFLKIHTRHHLRIIHDILN